MDNLFMMVRHWRTRLGRAGRAGQVCGNVSRVQLPLSAGAGLGLGRVVYVKPEGVRLRSSAIEIYVYHLISARVSTGYR